jgi:cytosine/adenosine deaminase-related metal-dependent hydrolase
VDLDPPRVERADLLLRDGVITARGVGLDAGDARVEDCAGRVVLPGLINCHTHLYSALAAGMPAPAVPDFQGALDQVWWPLDRALTLADLAPSAQVGLRDALLCGTTTVVDHHASPGAIAGSLDALAAVYEDLGLRGALCFETTDRNGEGEGAAGLAENVRANARYTGGMLRALTGYHASFTVSEETLAAGAAVAGPLHVHCAEGAGDVADARARGFDGEVARLEAHGLLRQGSLLVHGVHLTDDEITRARAAGCWLVHNPTSNRNNRVGYARPGRFGDRGVLGTDGLGSDMFGAARDAFFAAREHQHDVDVLALVVQGHRLASELLGVDLGRLQVGCVADVIRLDDEPRTPLHADNVFGHLVFAWQARHVRDVWVAGRHVVVDGALPPAPPVLDTAAALWGRYLEERG